MSYSLGQLSLIYLGSTVVFFAIDMLWLGVIAKSFYQTQLAAFMGPVNWVAAIIFYLVFIIGILFFVSLPAAETGLWYKALLYGALFGFFTYATYDLTNFATLKDWPFIVVVVDMIWGMVITSTVGLVGYFIARWIA